MNRSEKTLFHFFNRKWVREEVLEFLRQSVEAAEAE